MKAEVSKLQIDDKIAISVPSEDGTGPVLHETEISLSFLNKKKFSGGMILDAEGSDNVAYTSMTFSGATFTFVDGKWTSSDAGATVKVTENGKWTLSASDMTLVNNGGTIWYVKGKLAEDENKIQYTVKDNDDIYAIRLEKNFHPGKFVEPGRELTNKNDVLLDSMSLTEAKELIEEQSGGLLILNKKQIFDYVKNYPHLFAAEENDLLIGDRSEENMEALAAALGKDDASSLVGDALASEIIKTLQQGEEAEKQELFDIIEELESHSDSDDLLYAFDGEGDSSSALDSDTLLGLGGDDDLFGSLGDDYLFGGSGSDYLDGGEGADSIFAGAGNDRILADTEDKLIDGGIGNDLLIVDKDDLTDLLEMRDKGSADNIEMILFGQIEGESESATIEGINIAEMNFEDIGISFKKGNIELDDNVWSLEADQSYADYDRYVYNAGDEELTLLVEKLSSGSAS